MSQKLHNTRLAGAFTAMALLCALLLAEPVPNGHGANSGSVVFATTGHALGNSLDRHARRFESGMPGTGPASEALAIASAAVAASVVETTLTALIDDIGNPQLGNTTPRTEDPARTDRAPRSRRAMVMPYFSTTSGRVRGLGE